MVRQDLVRGQLLVARGKPSDSNTVIAFFFLWWRLVQLRVGSAHCRRWSPQWTLHLDVEVTGTDTDWTARVIETDTAAEELREVSVVRFSGGRRSYSSPGSRFR